MRVFTAAAFALVLSVPALAQSGTRPVPPPQAPSMTSSATTMAPVTPGSTVLHEVPTPTVEQRTNTIGTGTGQKLTGKGGN